jgi:hypothetical protein
LIYGDANKAITQSSLSRILSYRSRRFHHYSMMCAANAKKEKVISDMAPLKELFDMKSCSTCLRWLARGAFA